MEVIFASESANPLYNTTIWDPNTGTSLWQYKNGNSAPTETLTIIDGAYLLTADSNKPIINIWPINSQQRNTNLPHLKTPGKVTALAASPDSNYIVGAVGSTVYLWQLSSGRLIRTLQRHYLNVTCIRFLDSGTHFISGGEEGAVIVWELSKSEPLKLHNEHSLPVTGLSVGKGATQCRFVTSSLDRLCKVFDFASQTVLLTVICDHKLTACTLSQLETSIFLGCESGDIYEISLLNAPRTKEYHFTKKDNVFREHTSKITCLSTSIDNETLLSGSDNGQILIWNIPSRNFIRQLTPIKIGNIITNASFQYGYANIGAEKLRTRLVLKNLEMSPGEGDEVLQILNKDDGFLLDEEDVLSGPVIREGSLEELREENRRLRIINKQIYQAAVAKVVEEHVKNSESIVLTPGKLTVKSKKRKYK